MLAPRPLRVAVLVDLIKSSQAGGHVKCWERLAEAAVDERLPLDLTVYFSGTGSDEILGPQTRFRYLPPVFSTAGLTFLPYVPDHTDLARFHPRLASELSAFDVIHTTDGYFCFARTAARVSRQQNIPLVSSIHTDTPSYTRIFTRQTIEKLLGPHGLRGRFAAWLLDDLRLPERQEARMKRRLLEHLSHCRFAFVTRKEDEQSVTAAIDPRLIFRMRRGIDKKLFGPHKADRAGVERDYGIPAGKTVLLFVGRVDIGKNIYTLIESVERLIQEKFPIHVIVAGVGPGAEDVKRRLGANATVPGYVMPPELARLYASVDALTVLSEVETHSMIGVEALTSGCPILIARKNGVAQLFGNPDAMIGVESGVEAWINALREFSISRASHSGLRDSALRYAQDHLPAWGDVLTEDLWGVWQKATQIEENRLAA